MRRLRPTVNAPFPDGWFFKESITLLAPDGQANVIASSEPLSSEIDADKYASEQGELLKTFPGFREFTFEGMKVLGGREGYLRAFEWSPPDEKTPGPVRQLQLYCVVNGRGYTATATTPSSEFDRFQPQLIEILEGLLVEDEMAAH